MTLLDFYFYSAPIAGLILFFTGAHLGKCVRTKEHSSCLKEVGRLYDELRHLRKEIADLELENVQSKDQVSRLKRLVDFETQNSSAKSMIIGEHEDQIQVLTDQLQELFEDIAKLERQKGGLRQQLKAANCRLNILSSQYEKLLRSHMRNGGTTIR